MDDDNSKKIVKHKKSNVGLILGLFFLSIAACAIIIGFILFSGNNSDYDDYTEEYAINNNPTKKPTSNPIFNITPTPDSKLCTFCQTKKGVYKETIGDYEYNTCSNCSDKLTDVSHHQSDIDFYEELYKACLRSMENEEVANQVPDNVYEIVNSTIDFAFYLNGEEVVLIGSKDPFLKNVEYILGANFHWHNRTKLKETTYKLTIDFPNKTITKTDAPTKSKYAK